MQEITVSKAVLLEKLKANRDEHRKIFLEAQEGFRKAVIAELDSMLADARDGKKIRKMVTLIDPVDQTADYDRAIKMLEMSIDTNIQLSEHDFQSYVLDEWQWKSRFDSSNVGYSQTLSAKMSAQ